MSTPTDKTQDEEATFIRANSKDPITLSICLLKELPILVRCNKSLYQYNGKCFDLIGNEEIFQAIHSFVTKYGIVSAWKIRTDILASIMSTKAIPTINAFNPNPDLMCVENGALNIHTRELLPHSHLHYFDSYISIVYNDRDIDCPNFSKYLEDTFNGDQETIENIIRLGGYLLDSSCAAGKMFLFNGVGANGKSVLINTFSMFFHASQITAMSLDELASGSFDKEDLITSRFNQSAETKKGYLDAEEIKKIVTGDLIKVSRKFGRSVTFVPKTKIIVACNGYPTFKDHSDGIIRRLVLVDFNNKYYSKREMEMYGYSEERGYKMADYTMFDKIKEEKNAIFNLFLDGLQRLRADNYQFIIGEKLAELIKNFRRDSDTVREFLEDNYELNDRNEVSLDEIFAHYRIWYRSHVQDSSYMKFRINEMGRRVREVFNISPSRRKSYTNPDTHERELLTMYALGRKYIPLEIEEEMTEEQAKQEGLKF